MYPSSDDNQAAPDESAAVSPVPDTAADSQQPELLRGHEPEVLPHTREEAVPVSGDPAETDPKAIVEAILFAAEKPVRPRHIAQVVEGLDVRKVRKLIAELRSEYDEQGRAFQIEEIADGYQMLTRPEYRAWVMAARRAKRGTRLSEAALEALAIVAYKQPVTRARVEDIRGVQCDQVLRMLMERRLTRIVGRADTPGRPLLYGTTKEFMERFGLKSLKDLPTQRDLPQVT